eukprot:1930638-Prymnesium_polylepis.1
MPELGFRLSGYLHVSSEIALRIPDGRGDFLGVEGPVRALCLEDNGGAVDWQVVYLNGSAIETAGAADSPVYANTFINYEIHLARVRGYYETFIILPMILVMVATWVDFWISRDAQGNLVLISFLTLLTLIAAVLQVLPALPGFVWILMLQLVTTIFTVVAIVEYSGANFLEKCAMRLQQAVAASQKETAAKDFISTKIRQSAR